MLIYSFPGDLAQLHQVGGKGLSLILASKEGLPVPPGFILSVDFFEEWFQKLKQLKTWQKFLNSDEKDLQEICNGLKSEALKFDFSESQKKELDEILQKQDDSKLFAVRSSSPNEDLEGASFAGGYETVLGVKLEKLNDAIKKAFVSCLDYRVVVYKKQNGFEINDPKIAVIVQEQIDSEVSGVGFSINPVTNNYDEAVFNSNWGQGETVVSGIVSPDIFVVDGLSVKEYFI
jgi:phosphoenolpyruvate synthase/pyruvate phosphate dikinase